MDSMMSSMMGEPWWYMLLWLALLLALLLAAFFATVWLLNRATGGAQAQLGRASTIATPRADPLAWPAAASLVADPSAPHALRASDADREHVAAALSMHLAAGRLTVTEFDERVAAAYAARTIGQLRTQLEDLPVAACSQR